MKVVHNISVNADEIIQSELATFGIKVPLGFTVFEINEESPSWNTLEQKIREWGAADVVATSFSKKELFDASILKMNPSWHWGYPQPESKRAYLTATYQANSYCFACGCGGIQMTPFQVKEEPAWKKNKILQLNWVFDSFFCPPDVWEKFFKPFAINNMEVLEFPSSTNLKSIVQLVPQGKIAISEKLTPYPYKICSECGMKKYLPIARGAFPYSDVEHSMHLFLSEEWFGSGASGHQAVFVSHSLFRAITDAKITGVSFTPIF